MTSNLHKKIDNIIIVLGSFNDDGGGLSETAKVRCQAAKALYDECAGRAERSQLLCTGGANGATRCYNTHHAAHMGDYLKQLGLPADNVMLDPVDSRHTLEDAIYARDVIQKMANKPKRLYVTTSQFHIPRAMVTFRESFPDYPVLSCIAPNVEQPVFAADGSMTEEKIHQRELMDVESQKLLRYFENGMLVDNLTQKEMALLGQHSARLLERRKEQFAQRG